jgi:hypothetical protein
MGLKEKSGFCLRFPVVYVVTPSGGLQGVLTGNEWRTFVLAETGNYYFLVQSTGAGIFKLGLSRAPLAFICGGGLPLDELLVVKIPKSTARYERPVLPSDLNLVRISTFASRASGSETSGLRLEPGHQVSASISGPNEVDSYSFDARRGHAIDLTLVDGSGFSQAVTRMYLLSPSGVLVGSSDANNWLTPVLKETGTYTVHVVARYMLNTGDYTIGLWFRDSDHSADQTLVSGASIKHSVSSPGEVNHFAIEGQAGDRIELALSRTAGFSRFGVRACLFSPTSTLLGGFNAGDASSFVLPETGTYVCRIIARDLVETGAYTLELGMPLGR